MNEFLILLALVLFAGLVSLKREWGIYLIVLLLPTYQIRFQLGSIPLTFLECMILLLAGAEFFYLAKNEKITQTLKQTFGTNFLRSAFIFLFLGAAAISVFMGPDLQKSAGIFKAYFFDAILFYFLVILIIDNEKKLNRLWQILEILITYISIFGIYQLNKNINIDKGYLNNGEKIGSYLRTLKCNETLASTDAGAPAFLSKLDFIDLVGLNSEDIAKIYSKERNISKVIDYVENKEPGFIYLNTGNMLTELEKKDFIKEDYSLLDYKFFKERNTESKLYVKKGVRCKNLNINLA